ncbi:hypothetical protein JD844_012446 [Phrynosoma platyrhinos]|uniref:Uncharacterized protein n=1 Tax=Phrynosoma platyrhinos TaxID=52577 RepID=A0ABQ7TJJ5_PHRPL|nr:hypothetical protein JD844_012446 [Phrynosoma platyrhinos]
MGHEWNWLESKGEFFTDSEKSSSCQSFCGSLDSSLDLELELGSWREIEETAEEDLEESNSQEESEMDDSAACEKDNAKEQEEERTYKQEAVLRFLSEVWLVVGVTDERKGQLGPQALGAAEEKNGNGAQIQKEDTHESLAHTEEEVGEESQSQIFKKQDGENIAPQKKGNWPFQVSKSLPVINWQADRTKELEDLYMQPEYSQIQNSKFDENSGKKVLHILEEGAEEMEDEHFSSENMNQTFCNWRPLKEEILPSVKEEVAMENTEEQVEDWKDSDFHLSYSNDDSSPWGTPLMSSPSTSTASLPLMQLSQDDSPQQRLLFKKTLLSIWKMVAGHRYSGPFLKAVSEKQAPGYKDVVKSSVDLDLGLK